MKGRAGGFLSRAEQSTRFLVRKATHSVLRLQPRETRDIFFGCPNLLMARYLRPIWEVLRDDPRNRFFMGLKYPEYKPGENTRIRNALPVPEIGVRTAKLRPWDLVALADHGYYDFADPRFNPVVFTGHGLSGKVSAGDSIDYMYGPKAFDTTGRLRYTRIFEAADANRVRAIRSDPRLKDAIAVVGSPQADDLLETVQHRESFRRRLGFSAEDTVVFVMSTWGPTSLLHTAGEKIIAEARELMKRFSYRFVLTAHPHDYRTRRQDGRTWEEHLREIAAEGFIIRDPHEDWVPFMVSADVILTDHTSLAVYGALIEKPSVWVPVKDSAVAPKSILGRLQSISPILHENASLDPTLQAALHDFPFTTLKEIVHEINSCPGASRNRIKAELLQILDDR